MVPRNRISWDGPDATVLDFVFALPDLALDLSLASYSPFLTEFEYQVKGRPNTKSRTKEKHAKDQVKQLKDRESKTEPSQKKR